MVEKLSVEHQTIEIIFGELMTKVFDTVDLWISTWYLPRISMRNLKFVVLKAIFFFIYSIKNL